MEKGKRQIRRNHGLYLSNVMITFKTDANGENTPARDHDFPSITHVYHLPFQNEDCLHVRQQREDQIFILKL